MAAFGLEGKFKGRTDNSDHGYKGHPIPHLHPASGPNSVKSVPHPFPSTGDLL